MSKIRILAIPSDAHGVGKFRIINPYTHLQENHSEDFHVDIKFDVPDNNSEFDNYDIIVAHTFIHSKSEFERNISRIEWLKKQGKIVIIDIDDYWEPDPRHPMYVNIMKSGTPKKKIQLLKSASYVTTTTPIYRDTIMKRLGLKNILIFPNAIDETEQQFIPNSIESDKIRFGWLGGSSHLYDLQLMKEGISLVLQNFKDKTQFVLCGFDTRGNVNIYDKETKQVKARPIRPEETVWYKYEKFFTNDYKVLENNYLNYLLSFKKLPYPDLEQPYRRIWTKDIATYATGYNNFDISLAPLVDTVFNKNKSQLKIIEAGFHKKALIASESLPYTLDLVNGSNFGGGFNEKGNSLLVSQSKNHKQWGQHMKTLIENPNMIKDLGEKLYETVKVNYSLNKVNQDRVEFFKSIINY